MTKPVASPAAALSGVLKNVLDEQLDGLELDEETLTKLRGALNMTDLAGAVIAGQEAIANQEPKHTIRRNPDTGSIALRGALPDGRGVWRMYHADDTCGNDETTTPLEQAGYTQVLFDPSV
jgi:hypothetical protein